MKKKILLVSGCSNTDPNYTSLQHPDMDCDWPKWPELLAKSLDMECINLAINGSGNEFIYSTLIDKLQTIEPSDIGLCIAAWSTANRRDYESKGRWRGHMYYYKEKPPYITDLIDKSIRYFYSFQNVCENLKIPYRHFSMMSLYQSYGWQELMRRRTENFPEDEIQQIPIMNKRQILTEPEKAWLNEFELECANHIIKSPYYNIINHNFIGWPTSSLLNGYNMTHKVLLKDCIISELDSHPNAKGHIQIAKFLHELL
tara:strand:+ start:9 stop:779 length:771 start_codon:yes stop_codon:yes gene_type:complete